MQRYLYRLRLFAAISAGMLAPWSGALGQQRMVRVVDDNGRPVAFASVTLAGDPLRITNEQGEVEIGTASRVLVTADIRRLGYQTWNGTVALGDTLMVAQVSLLRIAPRTSTATSTDTASLAPSYLRGFYGRMLANQRQGGGGTFFTPEEIDRRSVNRTTALLQGLKSVSLTQTARGEVIAMSAGGQCPMIVFVDGRLVCPPSGCDNSASAPNAASSSGPRRGRGGGGNALPPDNQFVLIDKILVINEVAAVEVYSRGETVPRSLPMFDAPSCGLIALWSGGRRAR